MANPDKEVISFIGDGSYLLNNTDIYSSVITKNKLIIIVCDNGGFAVINRLQLFKGGKEFNNLLKSSKTPGLVDVDFAKHAESMGAKSEHVTSISDLEDLSRIVEEQSAREMTMQQVMMNGDYGTYGNDQLGGTECEPPEPCTEFQTARLVLAHLGFFTPAALRENINHMGGVGPLPRIVLLESEALHKI